jgi:hypothetical protein
MYAIMKSGLGLVPTAEILDADMGKFLAKFPTIYVNPIHTATM